MAAALILQHGVSMVIIAVKGIPFGGGIEKLTEEIGFALLKRS